jgi:cell division septal protein FtsQ
LALVAIIGVGSLFLVSQFMNRITLIADSGAASTGLQANRQAYEEQIAAYFDKNPLERLNFVLKPENLLSFLQQMSPEVELVEIRDLKGLPGEATIYLAFRKPIAKWAIGKDDYHVDKAGKTFKNNYFEAPALAVVDENKLTVKEGTAIASNRMLEAIGRMVSELDSLGIKVTKVTIPRGVTREFDVSIEGVAYYVKLSSSRPAAQQAEDVKRAVDHLRLSGANPTYIDARVAGRVYYK